MTEFTYNQTIEYEDCTRDLNFEAARRWAAEHGAAFEEDIVARKTVNGRLMRYFVIGEKPAPVVVEPAPVPEPTIEELKTQVRVVRNSYLKNTDFNMLSDAPITSTQKTKYKQYRAYLRDYPDSSEDWFKTDPMTFDEWSTSQTNA